MSRNLPFWVALILLAALVGVIALAVLAKRIPGPRGAVALGVLAGIAFAVLAIASRPLASGPLLELPLRPLAWLMVAAAVVGQYLLASALQRGSPTATMASMDATGILLASAAGLLVLGDQITPGRGWWVAVGLALVVAGVVAMALVAHTTVDGRPPVHSGTADHRTADHRTADHRTADHRKAAVAPGARGGQGEAPALRPDEEQVGTA